MTTISSNLGITFEESHPSQNTDWHGFGKSAFGPARLTESVDDHKWTVSDTAERPTLMKTVSWNQTQGAGTILSSSKLPWDILSASVSKTGFTNFEFFNGDINIKIIPNSNRFNQGMLMVHFLPLKLQAQDDLSNLFYSASRIYNMRALMIDAAVNNEVNLTIPFMHIKDYLPLAINDPTIDFQGTLVISVLSPLISTDTSGYVGLNIMGWVTESQFKVPAAEAHVLPSIPYGSNLTRNHRLLLRQQDAIGEELETFPAASIVAALAEPMIAGIASSLLPPTGPRPERDSVNAFTGPLNCTMGSMAASRSISVHERLALDPANVATVGPADFDTVSSEMSFSHILSIPSLLDKVEWSTTAAAGDIIWTSYIGPMPKMGSMTPGDRKSVV